MLIERNDKIDSRWDLEEIKKFLSNQLQNKDNNQEK
jgi:hypothetical protein